MNGIFIAILVSILGGILFFLIKPFLKKFTNKPVIKVEYISNSQGSESSNKSNLLFFKWKSSFRFKNISEYNAKNIEFLWPSNSPHIDLSFESNFFLKAFDDTDKKVIVEKYVSYDDLKGHKKDRFEYFMPKKLKKIAFILCYENEFGKKYYIRYKKDKEQVLIDNKPKMLKPKFKNEFSL